MVDFRPKKWPSDFKIVPQEFGITIIVNISSEEWDFFRILIGFKKIKNLAYFFPHR